MARRKRRASKAQIAGKPLEYPAAIQKRYEAYIYGLVKSLFREVVASVRQESGKAAFDAAPDQAAAGKRIVSRAQSAFERLFGNPLKRVEAVAADINKASARGVTTSLSEVAPAFAVNPSVISPAIRGTLQITVASNVQLIKSIGQEAIDRISQSVYSSISDGKGLDNVIDDLREKEGMSKRRAKTVALDQTRKAYSSLNETRLKAAGVTKAKWLHSGGGVHPRKSHVAYSGKVFDLSDPPHIGDNGEAVLPGQAINCKCRMIPVIDLGDGADG